MPHNKTQSLSHLPAVDELLRCVELAELRVAVPHERLVGWIRDAIARTRHDLLNGSKLDVAECQPAIIQQVIGARRADQRRAMQPVINATGIILHTNVGRAPLAAAAIARMQAAGAYTNLELDLQSGQRSRRGARVTELLAKLTGAEDALVVNNCAGATLLALQATAAGREVIISRGQLVEIGGGFRLPEVFEAAGVKLHEVGTTNRTYISDYQAALTEIPDTNQNIETTAEQRNPGPRPRVALAARASR
ncbi:MAG: hypothetical protein R3C53_07230 [Pirellulaceae bacterium]